MTPIPLRVLRTLSAEPPRDFCIFAYQLQSGPVLRIFPLNFSPIHLCQPNDSLLRMNAASMFGVSDPVLESREDKREHSHHDIKGSQEVVLTSSNGVHGALFKPQPSLF